MWLRSCSGFVIAGSRLLKRLWPQARSSSGHDLLAGVAGFTVVWVGDLEDRDDSLELRDKRSDLLATHAAIAALALGTAPRASRGRRALPAVGDEVVSAERESHIDDEFG